MVKFWQRSLLVMLSVCAIGFSYAQSAYHLKYYNRFGNPGTSNKEFDNQMDASWKNILGDSETQSYSPSQTINFPFEFNGASVSAFKVASTGFLTFATGTLPTPVTPENNDNFKLPSASLPNNSIYLGSISIAGSNDAVYTKVFGSAPHRQLWIKFNSMTPVVDSILGRVTVAIVLEETSNAIYFVEMTADGTSSPANPFLVFHNFAIQISPTESYSVGDKLGFTYSINGTKQLGHSKNLNDYTDNHFFAFFPGMASSNDIGVAPYHDLFASNYKVLQKSASGKFYVPTLVENGTNNKSMSYQLRYQFFESPSSLIKDTITQHNSIDFSTSIDEHSVLNLDSFTVLNAEGKLIRVLITVKSVNGIADDYKLNDSLFSNWYLVQKNGPTKNNRKMLLESFTGNWMPTAIETNAYQDSIKSKFKDSVIILNYHVADKMSTVVDSLAQITSYDFGNQLTYINSFNILDRGKQEIERNFDYSNYINKKLNRIAKADVIVKNLVYDSAAKNIYGTLTVRFLNYMVKSNLKVNALLMENHVRGLGAGFNQMAPDYILNDSAHYKKYGFYGFASPIVGYEHNRVVWSAVNGFWGKSLASGSDIFQPGDSVNWNFTVKIPKSPTKLDFQTANIGDTSYNFAYGKPMDYYVVGMATEDDEEPNEFTQPESFRNISKVGTWPVVVNADIKKVWDLSASTEKMGAKRSIRLYPNPASDYIIIESVTSTVKPKSVSLYSISGALLKQFPLDETNCIVNIQNLNSGLYILEMQYQDGTHAAVKWMKP